jgi:hypothetical protein
MNQTNKKVLFQEFRSREWRDRFQILLIISIAVAAVCVIVVVGWHHVRNVPYRPPTLFS